MPRQCLAALEIGADGARTAFVESACAGDAYPAASVRGVLQAHAHPPSFLDAAAAPLPARLSAEQPGSVVGR
jgi:hypothetical protein